MNRDPYAIALTNALAEIKKAYPDVKNSFLFTKTGSLIIKDQEIDEETTKNILASFQTIKEQTKIIGDFESFRINGKNGKLTLSTLNDMYLVLTTSKNADKTQIHSITQVILPTILKTLENIPFSHLQSPSPKKLVVDTISGFFAGNSVQIDTETLLELGEQIGEQNTEEIFNHVRIETFSGNSTICKVKESNDQNLKGKNRIRIPEKICDTLEIKKGDVVKVKPLI